jgi:hypothetical protein
MSSCKSNRCQGKGLETQKRTNRHSARPAQPVPELIVQILNQPISHPILKNTFPGVWVAGETAVAVMGLTGNNHRDAAHGHLQANRGGIHQSQVGDV